MPDRGNSPLAPARLAAARLVVASAFGVGLASVALASPTFVEGPTLAGSSPFPPPFSAAVGINNGGVAVGVSGVSNYAQRVVRYSAAGSADLPALSVAPGNTSNGGFSNAVGVSDDGVVVGTSRRYNGTTFVGTQGVYWDTDNAIHPLATPTPPSGGTSNVQPSVISHNGIVAAAATLFSSTNTLTGLPIVRYGTAGDAAVTLQSTTSSVNAKHYANGVNATGTVVGYANANGALLALRWRGSGTSVEQLHDLENNSTVGGTRGSNATAVNDADVAIGFCYHYVGNIYKGNIAVRWDAAGTTPTSLGSLEAAPDGSQSSVAALIDDAGDIAGTSSKYNGSTTSIGTFPVRWLPGSTTPIELGHLNIGTGLPTATVKAINASGAIVGSSGLGSTVHATVWTKDATAAIDLNTLIAPSANWTLTRADAISDTGWVAGLGSYDADGTGPTAAYDRLFSLLVPQAGTYGIGDANFDTKVDFSDLLVLAKHYGQPSDGSTAVGDFDLDGTTDFADLLTLAKHYGGGGGAASFEADWALAQSLVPEPATCGLALGVGAIVLSVRHRRLRAC